MSGGPVLVVDDDMVSRHVLGQALASARLDHVAVGSGAEALAQIEKIHPSIVLLDLVMPAPDGYQILRILRARPETRDLPVVVLTALDAEDEIAKAFEAGADDFVKQPFKPVELVARVRAQLRLRAAMVSLARKEKDASVALELTQALASNLDFPRDLVHGRAAHRRGREDRSRLKSVGASRPRSGAARGTWEFRIEAHYVASGLCLTPDMALHFLSASALQRREGSESHRQTGESAAKPRGSLDSHAQREPDT